MTWFIGVLLVLVGAGWIALRVVIERGAGKGSWLSHLAKQLAVIGHIPLVGFLWKILPILLVAAGIAWLAGVRPFGLGGRTREAPATRCGHRDATPPSEISSSDWSSYECKTRAQAGDDWARCLPYDAYAGGGPGCPGASRCCP